MRSGHTCSPRLLAREKIPSIYINDDFDDWSGDFSGLIDRCARQDGAAHEIVYLLQPGDGEYVLMKPRHSAFYGSALEFLLEELKVKRLILTGLEADVCIFSGTAWPTAKRMMNGYPSKDVCSTPTRRKRNGGSR